MYSRPTYVHTPSALQAFRLLRGPLQARLFPTMRYATVHFFLQKRYLVPCTSTGILQFSTVIRTWYVVYAWTAIKAHNKPGRGGDSRRVMTYLDLRFAVTRFDFETERSVQHDELCAQRRQSRVSSGHDAHRRLFFL